MDLKFSPLLIWAPRLLHFQDFPTPPYLDPPYLLGTVEHVFDCTCPFAFDLYVGVHKAALNKKKMANPVSSVN